MTTTADSMVAINLDMDLGVAWERDDPRYPEPMTTLAYRFAVNYVVLRDDALKARPESPRLYLDDSMGRA